MEFTDSKDSIVFSQRRKSMRGPILLLGSLCLAIGIGVGILIGRFAVCSEEEQVLSTTTPTVGVTDSSRQDTVIEDRIIQDISNETIKQYLRELSSKPHVAGTEAEHEVARYLRDFWESVGIDEVTMTPYDVLLSYPNESDPNFIQLLNKTDGSEIYRSPIHELPLTPGQNGSTALPPFNAYSAPGDIQGDLVYVNYGRVEDFDYLENNTGINVTGKVVLVRYGKLFRGDKLRFAEMRGALGMIIFSDPEDYTNGDFEDVYPHNWYLPPTGAQKGTVYVANGDPQTPGYPSSDYSFRYAEDEIPHRMPKIPCHPIGYGIAGKLIAELGGDEAPADWQGGINITYRFGGSFKKPELKVRLKISTQNSQRTIYNVIGIIRGSVEPDRYVIIGNHRDAWAYGAIDPDSGTATMMEVSRVMGNLVKEGVWRPRRSIVFCSWGAEEYGLIGSTEWIEQYMKSLHSRAIAHLNMDIAVEGNYTFSCDGMPLLYRVVHEATKKVPNPNPTEVEAGRHTVYDTWAHTTPWKEDSADLGFPRIGAIGSGSDHAPFIALVGIPSVVFRYTHKPDHLSSYPLYHSVYETVYAMENFMDRNYQYHQAVGRAMTAMTLMLTDTPIIPFNVSDYSWTLQRLAQTFEDEFGQKMRDHNINLDNLHRVLQNFSDDVMSFESAVEQERLSKDPLTLRRINDQLMLLERAFTDPAGLPGRQLSRHMIFAHSSLNQYAGSSFPGLVDSLFEIDKDSDQKTRWQNVEKHFSVILFTIESAGSTLRNVVNFMKT